jgi:hypothetical protein
MHVIMNLNATNKEQFHYEGVREAYENEIEMVRSPRIVNVAELREQQLPYMNYTKSFS